LPPLKTYVKRIKSGAVHPVPVDPCRVLVNSEPCPSNSIGVDRDVAGSLEFLRRITAEYGFKQIPFIKQ
jgi:hypothetical protein